MPITGLSCVVHAPADERATAAMQPHNKDALVRACYKIQAEDEDCTRPRRVRLLQLIFIVFIDYIFQKYVSRVLRHLNDLWLCGVVDSEWSLTIMDTNSSIRSTCFSINFTASATIHPFFTLMSKDVSPISYSSASTEPDLSMVVHLLEKCVRRS